MVLRGSRSSRWICQTNVGSNWRSRVYLSIGSIRSSPTWWFLAWQLRDQPLYSSGWPGLMNWLQFWACGNICLAVSKKHLLDAEIKVGGAKTLHHWQLYQAVKSGMIYIPIAYFIQFAISLAMGTETVSSFLYTLNYPVLSVIWGLAIASLEYFGRTMRTKYIK